MKRSTEGHVYEKVACKYCGDQISINAMARHEARCQNATPEQREHRKNSRDWFKHNGRGAAKPEPTRKQTRTAELGWSHQADDSLAPKQLVKPMSISMLVEEDTVAMALGRLVIQKLPELLPQLIPGLAIEAFVAKHVRGPNKGKE